MPALYRKPDMQLGIPTEGTLRPVSALSIKLECGADSVDEVDGSVWSGYRQRCRQADNSFSSAQELGSVAVDDNSWSPREAHVR